MASSSQKTPPEEEEKDRDWLELGLGFGAACGKQQHQEEECVLPNPFPVPSVVSVSPSSSQLQAHQTELGLGLRLALGLGLDNDDHREIDHHMAVPFSNHHRLWKNQDDHTDHDLASWPSDGIPGLHDDWQLQVPNYLHDNHSTSGRCRPHPAGLWFTLQSYTNQKGEKLPQIPKAYIRVKDENLTVLMVKKYLVTKLGLSNEAEISVHDKFYHFIKLCHLYV
ncbi:hypothetical protein SLEP1_g3078 [Rubroshorea leprosula]|uniref:Uncharacterized protein n=1 Tax=Rubroshorea leprosula TaxID=152421 RepID=A0AAV5HSX9_9ROSI|nr:hypothetical protein SLEP1_g3078 [Rubroshorea leprosula]